MSAIRDDEVQLRRLLGVLSPYARDVLLIGGWVPTLYARYGSDAPWPTRNSLTLELDVAVPGSGITAAHRPLLAELMTAAGLIPHPNAPISPAGAPVWVGDITSGAMIEFLMPHRGPHRAKPAAQAVIGQRGIAALPLHGVALLWRAPRWLELSGTPAIHVRVPALGMYVLNKATTFAQRVPPTGERRNPKQGKDLVYLHDCALAGSAVVQAIIQDIAAGCDEDAQQQPDIPRVSDAVNKAVSHLEGIADGRFAPAMEEATLLLSERDDLSATAARAKLRGALDDLHDILAPFRSPAPIVDWD